jgi:hypothetical protein
MPSDAVSCSASSGGRSSWIGPVVVTTFQPGDSRSACSV